MRRHFLWRRTTSRHVDCRHVGVWLQSYLDGELDDVRQRDVSRHLRNCRRCGMEASIYVGLKASLRRTVPTPDERASLNRLRNFAERLAGGNVDLA